MEDTPSINGWTPPVVYDVLTDSYRVATQDDINRMERTIRLLGDFYRECKRNIERLDEENRTGRTPAQPPE